MGVPTVFISSTRLDLLRTGYRAAAREAAVNAGFLPLGMEDFAPSGDKYTLEKCLEYVSRADLLVVIVAHRYGWIPPDQPNGQTKSVTWLECEHARDVRRIEVLRFLVKDDDDKWKWPTHLREGYRLMQAVEQGTATEELGKEVEHACSQLRAFKAWLEKGRGIRREFDSPAELSKWLAIGLYQWRERNPKFGPAPAGDPSAYLEKLWAATRWIDIKGLQVGDAIKKQFEISRIYIPLTTAGVGEPSKGKGAEALEGRARGVPLEQALAQPRLIIVGDPGAGKTTFVRRVAFALCQSLRGLDQTDAERFLGAKDRPFPILISAAELAAHIDRSLPQEGRHPTARDSHDWIPHFLGRRSEEHDWGLSEEFFRRKMKSDACLLLVDGMDEVPGRVERESLARLIEKAAEAYKHCRFVVTTRPHTHRGKAVLGAGFVTAQIGDLEPEAVHRFLEEWAQALYPDEPAKAETFRTQLERSVTSRRDIRRLARNPVMLTALAVLQANNRRLPEERVGLYESILTWLAQSREAKPGRVRAEKCLELLQKLALAMQAHRDGRQVQVGLGWATDQLACEFPQRAEAERFLVAEEADSGIVVSRANELRFWHLTFQEYLAARQIASLADTTQYELLVQSRKLYQPEWREVMLLLAGVLLHRQGKEKAEGLFRAILDQLGKRPALPKQAPCAGLLGAMMRDLAPMGFQPKDPRYRKTVLAVQRIFDPKASERIDLHTRIEAAEALGQVGDPRLDEDNWVTIPAGTFWMGAQAQPGRNRDPGAYPDEAPVHEVLLDAFQISRYPITVQEFARFMEEGGYENEPYWRETGGFGQFQEPDEWQDQQLHRNRPVVGVSWFEAAAYSKWAGARLPTEAEWERAARGSRGGKYPWGNQPIAPSRANYGGKVGRPTPVGLYPRGATSEGVFDMVGNVWEWCSGWYGPYPAQRVENPTGPEKGDSRVLRGGSWLHAARLARVSSRYWFQPEIPPDDFGFRCAREVKPDLKTRSGAGDRTGTPS